MGDNGKSLVGDKIDTIHCSPLMQSFQCRRPLVVYDFPLVNICWLLITSLYFMFLGIVPSISCIITFPEIEVSLTSVWFCRFLWFLKMKVTFSFLQILGTSPSFRDNSYIESALAYLLLMKNTSISSTCASSWVLSAVFEIFSYFNPYRVEILSCPLKQLFLMLNNQPTNFDFFRFIRYIFCKRCIQVVPH